MRTKIIAVFICLALIGAGAAWFLFHRQSPSGGGFDGTQNALPPETKKVLDGGQQFILLSLDPKQPSLRPETDASSKEMFHDYVILGKTEIRDEKTRTDLLQALYKGIADSDGLVANCFNPRHGISATLDGETVDLVICFECLSIRIHAKTNMSVLTTSSPEPAFSGALQKADLPIEKKK